jgi:hypothetical protein
VLFQSEDGLRLWHYLQQRIGTDRGLPNERSVIRADEQKAGGCTGGKEPHSAEGCGPHISVGKSYRD